MLLEEWLNKEVSFGDLGDISLVQKKAPRKVKRKRPIPTDDGATIAYALCSVFSLHFCLKTFTSACVAMLCITQYPLNFESGKWQAQICCLSLSFFPLEL